ncbi:hypothetical protein [uncultured Paraglaciecola sp.]|mgnify:CR=1 FL=1|uniref:hypothetical protein n=1 Tax=uncultured Paraglaciecola sp. TaxID=1765024 RepID=UPI00260D2E54|nr:hypothetical protein [uncultured Paraglaciecola sp.]
MANVDRVNGFTPIRHLTGAPYNGQMEEYAITAADSTAVFVGDLVKLSGEADSEGRATVAQAAAGDAVVGVVVGLGVDPDKLNITYREASTYRKVLVANAPDLIFEVQADAVLAAASVGLNADFVVAAGSTTTGRSGMELDASTAATTATLPLKIHRMNSRVDNEIDVTNAKIEVMINVHQLAAGSAGV